MAHEENIKIVEGEEAREHLGNRDLIHLTNRVNKIERGQIVGHLRYTIGSAIQLLLGKGNMASEVRGKIDPVFYPIEHMKSLRKLGHIAVAKDGDRTVGMAGFEQCGFDPHSGRQVYEVRRVAVRKKEEKRGIGGQLHRTIFERVRIIDPQALILVEAWDQAIMNQCRKMGYQERDVYEGLVMKGYPEDRARELIPWYQEKGYKFFVYDPSSDASERQ